MFDRRGPREDGSARGDGPAFLVAFLAGDRNIRWCACVTRTSDLRRIGPIPTDVFCEDMFYWTKLAAMGDVGCVSDELSHYVWYRDGGTNISSGATLAEWTMEANTLGRRGAPG